MPTRRPPTAIAILAVAVGVLSLLPFVYLFAAGVSLESIGTLFSYPNTVPDLIRTIVLTLAITAVCVVLGVYGAVVVVRTDVPWRRLLTVVLAMPLAVPLFVSSYAAYSANLLVAPRMEIVPSFAGATAVMSLVLYPYVFLACVVALRNVDPAQEEVARSLRDRPWTAFRRVVLPQLRPAIAAGSLIVALHVLGEYGAMVQTKQRTLTTRIMSDVLTFGNYESARSLSLLLAVIAIAFVAGGRFLSGPSVPLTVGSQAARVTRRVRLGPYRPLVVVLTLAIPVAALGPTLYMTVRGLLAPHRALVVSWGQVLSATGVTFGYAAWAALAGSLCALPVAWWLSRHPSGWSRLTERSVWLAHALPGAILALALVHLATRMLPGLYKTAPLLVIAYVILFLPLAVANQEVGLQAAMPRYDEAAASLGSSPLGRLRRVTLPIALPGIATGALLLGLDASKELTTTLMLLPFNTQTLATGLWSTTEGETLDFTAAAPYALMLLLVGSVPVYLIVRRTLRYVS